MLQDGVSWEYLVKEVICIEGFIFSFILYLTCALSSVVYLGYGMALQALGCLLIFEGVSC